MKIFTTRGRKVKKTESQYERFISIHIQLGKSNREARVEWKFLNAKIQIKSQAYA